MADRAGRPRVGGRLAISLALLGGIAAILVAMVAGLAPALLAAVASPPPLIRAVLAGAATVLGGWLLVSAVRRIDGSMHRDPSDGRITDAELGTLVRGVRLVFLAAAAFTAAAGWILAEPLPLVVALVIAGVDVVETSFLLLVASRREG
jgi:hypothetical protein